VLGALGVQAGVEHDGHRVIGLVDHPEAVWGLRVEGQVPRHIQLVIGCRDHVDLDLVQAVALVSEHSETGELHFFFRRIAVASQQGDGQQQTGDQGRDSHVGRGSVWS
jgi:hypothetical protein